MNDLTTGVARTVVSGGVACGATWMSVPRLADSAARYQRADS